MYTGSLQLSSTSFTIRYVLLYHDQTRANAFPPTFLWSKARHLTTLPVNVSYNPFSASLLCLNARQCTTLAVRIFYSLLFSSLLSINARYFKMCTIKVYCGHIHLLFTTECASLKYAYRLRLDFIIHCLPLSYGRVRATFLRLQSATPLIRYLPFCYIWMHTTALRVDNVLFHALSTSLLWLNTRKCFQGEVIAFYNALTASLTWLNERQCTHLQ